jgi:hypothetical protein
MSAAGSASGGQVSKVSHFRRRALPSRAEVRAAAADSVLLAVACLISYWLTTRVLTLVYSVSKDDDALGGMWAVVATVFLFRDSYNQSLAAAVSRMAATLVSFVLCAVGLVAAWLGLRAIRPRIRPPESPLAKPLGEFAL